MSPRIVSHLNLVQDVQLPNRTITSDIHPRVVRIPSNPRRTEASRRGTSLYVIRPQDVAVSVGIILCSDGFVNHLLVVVMALALALAFTLAFTGLGRLEWDLDDLVPCCGDSVPAAMERDVEVFEILVEFTVHGGGMGLDG